MLLFYTSLLSTTYMKLFAWILEELPLFPVLKSVLPLLRLTSAESRRPIISFTSS